MVEESGPRTALISLHPEWADAIFQGRKTVEFRRNVPARPVSHIVVYVTKPVGHVAGYFTIRAIHEDTPSRLWDRFGDRGCIGRHQFRRYYRSASIGYAIEIAEAVSLEKPIDLRDIDTGLSAPQNFRYLSSVVAGGLLALP
ncbi:MAG: ASCH domain-containing protein [Dehalococcoidia bacterium]